MVQWFIKKKQKKQLLSSSAKFFHHFFFLFLKEDKRNTSKCANFYHMYSAYINISYLETVSPKKLEHQGLSSLKIVFQVHDEAECLG